jgi:hypothetical protein
LSFITTNEGRIKIKRENNFEKRFEDCLDFGLIPFLISFFLYLVKVPHLLVERKDVKRCGRGVGNASRVSPGVATGIWLCI